MLNTLKTTYSFICKVEEFLTSFALCAITFLVFVSAIGRFIGYPINWAIDISLLLLAWGAFLGADIGIRKNRVINVDFLTSKMPVATQKMIAIAWSVAIILFLVVLIAYGIPLCITNAKRQFQYIALSYSFVTASLPVCALLMIISSGLKLKKQITDFPSTLRGGGTDVA